MLPTKNAVRNAGKNATRAGDIRNISLKDLEIFDTWRKAHLLPLISIAMWLRKPSLDATGLAPAQRLKRRDTFLDKLISSRARDASTMQDLGGCRLIFPDLQRMHEFRHYLDNKTRAKHELTHER